MDILSLTTRQKYTLEKRQFFNTWCWENWSTICKRMKLEHFLTPYTHTKKNSKWIKDLNVRPETIQLLEENIGKTLSNINHIRILYDPSPRILEIKPRINKWDLIKIKSFCTTKKTISKVKSETDSEVATPWTAAHQAPLSVGFSRQEYCSGVPL